MQDAWKVIPWLCMVYGCTPHPKPPVVVPTPPPVVDTVKYKELELRQANGVLTRGGQPHTARMGIFCCMDAPAGVPTIMWPGVSKEGIDWLVAKGNVNLVHFRLGPFFADAEPSYAEIGGALNADGTFNEKYWTFVESVVDHAGSKGVNVQVDLIDGWGCKVSARGDRYMSFPAEDIHACGKTFTPKHREFVQYAVKRLDRWANIIWEISNESGQIEGFQPQWELDMVAAIREAEHFTAHMIGTNSENADVEASSKVDYIARHRRTGIDGPQFNKWTMQNEHNPEYPTPAQEHALFCSAQVAGQLWAAWRAGQSEADYVETLGLNAQGCEGFQPGACPFAVPPVSYVSCKKHADADNGGELWDCTPLVNDRDYCRTAGFPDRIVCPLRSEGDPFREPCEVASMGGDGPSYQSSSPQVTLETRGNWAQFILRWPQGTGQSLISCTVPSRGSQNVCVQAGTTNPILVTR